MLNSIFHRDAAAFSVARIFVISLTVAVAASCTRPAKFPKRVSVAEVVNNVRCELLSAVRNNEHQYPWIRDWTAKFTLFLEIDRTAGADGDSSFVVPIKHGTFTLGLTAKLNKQAKNSIDIDFVVPYLGDQQTYQCKEYASDDENRPLLAGEIGLKKWLDEVIPDMHESGIHENVGKIGSDGVVYKIDFVITTGGSIKPSWALSYPSGRMFNASIKGSGEKKNTHQLTVAMTPLSAAALAEIRAQRIRILRLMADQKFYREESVRLTNLAEKKERFAQKQEDEVRKKINELKVDLGSQERANLEKQSLADQYKSLRARGLGVPETAQEFDGEKALRDAETAKGDAKDLREQAQSARIRANNAGRTIQQAKRAPRIRPDRNVRERLDTLLLRSAIRDIDR